MKKAAAMVAIMATMLNEGLTNFKDSVVGNGATIPVRKQFGGSKWRRSTKRNSKLEAKQRKERKAKRRIANQSRAINSYNAKF